MDHQLLVQSCWKPLKSVRKKPDLNTGNFSISHCMIMPYLLQRVASLHQQGPLVPLPTRYHPGPPAPPSSYNSGYKQINLSLLIYKSIYTHKPLANLSYHSPLHGRCSSHLTSSYIYLPSHELQCLISIICTDIIGIICVIVFIIIQITTVS